MNTLDLFSLKGKTAIVAGGMGLLGQVVCETVRELGGVAVTIDTQVGATYLRDITNIGHVEYVAEMFSKVDIVVNCAIGNQGPVSFPTSLWDKDIEIGLTGAANLMSVFYRHLRATKGVFLNIGSDLSLMAPDPDRYAPQFKPVSYSVVKHGIIGMTRYYAALWGRDGIRVNCLCPGGIDQGQAVPRCPLNRLAQPEEMKGAIALMVSSASSYMTGAVVSVDGGSTV